MTDKKITRKYIKKSSVVKLPDHRSPKLKLDEGAELLMKELINEFPDVDKIKFQNCFNKVYNLLYTRKYGDNVYEKVLINHKDYYINNIGDIFDSNLVLSGYCYKNGKGITEYHIFEDLLNIDKIDEFMTKL